MNPKSHTSFQLVMAIILIIMVGPLAIAQTPPQAAYQQPQPNLYRTTAPAQSAPSTIVRSPNLQLTYQIQDVAPADLDRVEIWYATPDSSYQLYGYDSDLTSPASFVAPGDGTYRILIVAVDRYQQRSQNLNPYPTDHGQIIPFDTPAHVTVLVDSFRPQLFLYSPRENYPEYAQRTLRVQWAGADHNLAENPVQLFYQQPGDPAWTPIHQPMPAIGEYNWQFPPQLSGQTLIKAVIIDNAGNSTTEYSGWINITSVAPTQTQPAAPTQNINPTPNSTTTAPVSTPVTQTPSANPQPQNVSITTTQPDQPNVIPQPQNYNTQAANEWFNRGQLHIQRFEWPDAVYAFEQSLQYDPTSLQTRMSLADAYYRLGQYPQAQHQYELVLQLEPNTTAALRQLAHVHQAAGQYPQAQQALDHLLNINSEDWHAWLLRGDNADRMGNRTLALDSWQIAANGAAQSMPAVAQMAQQRISQYRP
ncbi:MAG: tetratricopeptide repeat protein [Sedimentisphaerales bacterium]|nr:tetratricopeptide repeat protein [Sedimentisphaerales bacterium]